MNIDTGRIVVIDENTMEREALMQRLVPIEAALMTEKQRANMAVSLHDTRSALGRELHAARSKYMPHAGAEELAKAAQRGANTH